MIAVFPVLIVLALLLAALDFFFADSGSGSVKAFIPIFIAYFLHRSVLFQPASWLRPNAGQLNGQPMPPEYIGRFIGASLIPGVLIFLLAIAIGLSMSEEFGSDETIIVLGALVGFAMWVYLSLFGMQFPAMAAGRRFSMIDPLRATWANRGRVAIALLFVSGPIWLLYLVGAMFLATVIGPMTTGWDPVFRDLLSSFAGELFSMIPSVATVVILCRGYIRHYPR